MLKGCKFSGNNNHTHMNPPLESHGGKCVGFQIDEFFAFF
jgi:hypothetical protein